MNGIILEFYQDKQALSAKHVRPHILKEYIKNYRASCQKSY